MALELDYYLPSYNAWKDEDLEKKKDLLPYMKSMVLNGSKITDKGLSLLPNCTKIRELHLISTNVTNEGLKYVSQLKSLDWLVIDEARISDEGLRHLSSLCNIESLQVVNTRISDDGLEALFHFPKIQYLEAVSDHISEKAFSIIAQQPSLRTLRVASDSISDEDFLHLAFCKNLKSLSYDMPLVSRAAFEELVNRLPECEIDRFSYYDYAEKFSPLMIHVLNLYNSGKYHYALNAINEAVEINYKHPVVYGMRALIHLKMGSFSGFKENMLALKDLAVKYQDLNLESLADKYLEEGKIAVLNVMIAKEKPEEILMGTLYNQYTEKPKQKQIRHIIAPNFSPIFQPPPIQVPKQFAGLPSFNERNDALAGFEIWAEEQRRKASQFIKSEAGYIPQPRPEMILLQKFRNALIKREQNDDDTQDNQQNRRGQLPPWQW